MEIRTYQKNKVCSKRSESIGFTLIELIIVVVIVALTLAVSIPRLGSIFEATSFRRLVNNVIVFLKDARVDAISSGKKVSVVVDLEESKFVRLTEGGNEKDLQMPEEVELEVNQEVELEDERIEFAFYPNGTASGPRLFLKDTNKGKNAIIYLEPLAGLVRYKIGVSEEED